MGRPLSVKGKMEGKGRKGQSRGKVEGKGRNGQSREGRCLGRGCGVRGAYGRERKQGQQLPPPQTQ